MQGEVYNQSVCLMNEVVYRFYIKKETRSEIAERLSISKSTISRLLKRAEEEKIIKFQMVPSVLECIKLEETIIKKFGLREVLVVPVGNFAQINTINLEEIKKKVALEGARYLQRIITDDDIVGFTWGGTMYYLIQYLNPCRRKGAKIVTLHGSIANCDSRFAVDTLVHRAAMAFGGKNISLCRGGLLTGDEMRILKQSRYYAQIQMLFSNINIAISGVGALYPEVTTPLATTQYLTSKELNELKEQDACCDLLLRFIDKKGKECLTSMKDRTYSIDLETYRKIPRKVIVASSIEKAYAINALISGKLVDVLIVDQMLAQALIAINA